MAGEAGAHLYAGVLTVDKLDVQKRIISLCRVLTFSFVRKATLNAHLISAPLGHSGAEVACRS